MDSPQLENGYTKIVNELMDALIKYRIPGEQMQCLLFIIRKTYGWNKKEDDISLSQFVDATGINKPCVVRAINGLKEKKIIAVIKKDNRTTTTYRFNKFYKTWKALSKKIIVIKKDNKSLSKKIHTKETIQKKVCKKFTPPEIQDVLKYFQKKGYTVESGKKAFDYYTEGNWRDSNGKKIKNWKQKMIGVWFKPGNKIKNNPHMPDSEKEFCHDDKF